jgi:hypothetical protein
MSRRTSQDRKSTWTAETRTARRRQQHDGSYRFDVVDRTPVLATAYGPYHIEIVDRKPVCGVYRATAEDLTGQHDRRSVPHRLEASPAGQPTTC